jgi:signal transduction histidine kinase
LDLALHELTLDTQKMVGKHQVISWYADLKEPLHMEEEKKTAIYRIAQEAVTNARKHADAQSIRVKLEKTAKGEMLLFIEDDGIGMPDEARRSEKHYGLEGMYERALMIGADLHISSHPGAGTTVVLRFSL